MRRPAPSIDGVDGRGGGGGGGGEGVQHFRSTNVKNVSQTVADIASLRAAYRDEADECVYRAAARRFHRERIASGVPITTTSCNATVALARAAAHLEHRHHERAASARANAVHGSHYEGEEEAGWQTDEWCDEILSAAEPQAR